MAAKKDFTQVAFAVLQQATDVVRPAETTERQESGRKGGLKGGATRAARLSAGDRSAIAKKAAAARWKKP